MGQAVVLQQTPFTEGNRTETGGLWEGQGSVPEEVQVEEEQQQKLMR